MRFTIFGATGIDDYFNINRDALLKEIDDIYTVEIDEQELYDYLLNKYELTEIKLGEEKASTKLIKKNREKKIKIVVEIPFYGDRELFAYRPNPFIHLDKLNVYIEGSGDEKRNKICIELEFYISIEKSQINYEIEYVKNLLLRNIQNLNNNIQKYNKQLERIVKSQIAQAKKTYTKFQELTEAIKIPLKKREKTPPEIPIVRKKLVIKPPTPRERRNLSDPVIALQMYEEILVICSQMSIAMERTPSTFKDLSEMDIRNFFLVMLNAFFEGETTGETFNGKGDTDILVRYEKEHAFIAECKIWNGTKYIKKGINQLFKYITWHDTKTAIIIFHKGKNESFSNILQKIKTLARNHDNHIKEYEFESKFLKKDNVFSFKFKHPKDDLKEFFLTFLAFHIDIS